jgi:hypothetical protein
MRGRAGGDISGANRVIIGAILVYAVVRAVIGEGIHLTGSVSGQVGDLLSFSLTCALLSYGTVEGLKRVVQLRGWFQLRETRRWLSVRQRNAYWELLKLLRVSGSGAERLRVFNLPVEQLSAQIGTAVDRALDASPEYSELIESLAGADAWSGAHGLKSAPAVDDSDALLLTQGVRAGIDRLQIFLGEGWRIAVQGASMWIAGLYGIGLVQAAHLSDRSEPRYVLAALLLGGPIAWTLRDGAALLERARR